LSGGERPSPPSRRSGAAKLGAACSGRCRNGWQAAPTKPWRVGTARRRGCGERGGKAYARNRRSTPLKDAPARTWRIWAGGDAHPISLITEAGELPDMSAGLRGGRGDVLRGSHGDVAGVESGASSVERSTSEHGNRPWSAPLSTSPTWPGGWAHRLPIGQGRGGAVVVVRGRESRSHGEGRQWFREEIGGCNAERRGTEW
jgi:hypothetical protein